MTTDINRKAPEMKICCTADLHGHLPNIPPCDILVIAGDIRPRTAPHVEQQADFLNGPLKRWLDQIPAKDVVATWGNHDFIGQVAPFAVPNLRWHLLVDHAAVVQGLRFWGSPYQLWFWDWAFNAPAINGEKFLEEKFSKIPSDTDVLIVHGPPYGYGDQTTDGNLGSTALLDAIDRRTSIKLSVHGHIHQGYGQYQRGPTRIVNASLVNHQWQPANPPLLITL